MKMFMLMVLFSTAETPLPHTAPGFGPLQAPTMAECIESREQLQGYLRDTLPEKVKFKAFCVEIQTLGFEEALRAFTDEIGEGT